MRRPAVALRSPVIWRPIASLRTTAATLGSAPCPPPCPPPGPPPPWPRPCLRGPGGVICSSCLYWSAVRIALSFVFTSASRSASFFRSSSVRFEILHRKARQQVIPRRRAILPARTVPSPGHRRDPHQDRCPAPAHFPAPGQDHYLVPGPPSSGAAKAFIIAMRQLPAIEFDFSTTP